MDTLLLEYFVKVAAHQNLSRAAQDLHISQPSLSVAIKKLEAELGADLFIRIGKRLRISDFGQTFLVTARQVLMLLNENKRPSSSTQKKAFNILFRAPEQRITTLVERFHKLHPDISITTVSGNYSGRDIPLTYYDFIVDEGGVDLPSTMQVINLPPRKYYAVLPVTHWLSQEKSLKLLQLKDEEFIFQRSVQYDYEGLFQLCINEGFVPKCSLTASDVIYKMHFIAQECGIGLVPDIWLDIYEQFDNLALIPLEGDWSSRCPKLLVSESVSSNPSACLFLEQVGLLLSSNKFI